MKYFGILNVTPDSFSDGNLYFEKERAIEHAKELAKKCEVIDIGGVSTRPDAKMITVKQELKRLGNVVEEISKFAKVSVDSFNFEVQMEAMRQGALFVNDVMGFADERILKQAPKEVRFVFMHHLTVPPKTGVCMKQFGMEMIQEILFWAHSKIRRFHGFGIENERLIFDVGIGFGKNFEQNMDILKHIEEFHSLNVEIMVGHSRKSFLNNIKKEPSLEEKDRMTQIITEDLKTKGVQWARVHNPL